MTIIEQRRGLAILGADQPTFAHPIHVGRPNEPDRDELHRLLDEILDRNWLSNNGPLVKQLEAQVAEVTGTRHALATCNGTLGLELVVRALGMAGRVMVPSFTFVASAHCLKWQGIEPVFVDIDPTTHLIDPAALDRSLRPDVTGIMAVHLWGNACDRAALSRYADSRGLALVFDAAHAFANRYPDGRPIGCGGAAEVFSLHATKFVNAFEGGMVTTDSDELADRIDTMRNFGFTGTDHVGHVGTNAKMSEMSAAMGLASLRTMAQVAEINRENFEAYAAALAGVPGVSMLAHQDGNINHQYVVIELDASEAGIGRDLLVEVLHAENVLARRYFYPGAHQAEPYRSEQPHASMFLPKTEVVGSRVLVLPTGRAVTPGMAGEIGGLIARVVETADELVRWDDRRSAG